ncbi:MAG: hypothetical protein ACRD1C_03830 [Terriglobales bacterium]
MPDDLEVLDSPATAAASDAGGDAPASVTADAGAEPDAAARGPETPGGASPAAPENADAPIELDYPDGQEEAEDSPEPAAASAETEPEADQAAGSARFGTGALTRILKENPELAKAAESNPRVRAQLYQMARRSQELAAYQDSLPSLAQAKEASEARETLANYDQSYFGKEPEAFWSGLYQASGQTGAYERNVRFLQQVFLDGVEQKARQGGDEALQDAVTAIRETLDWGSSRNPPASRAKDRTTAQFDEGNLPPHIRQQLDAGERNARELEQLRSRLSDGERQTQEHFLDTTAEEAAREITGFVGGILADARLSDYDKANITRDFLEEVRRVGDADKVHNAALSETFERGGMTPQTRAQMVAQAKAWVRQNGREILEPILKRAGAGLRERQAQRQTAAASVRREPQATGRPAAVAIPTGRELVSQREKTLGRRLSDREILDLA